MKARFHGADMVEAGRDPRAGGCRPEAEFGAVDILVNNAGIQHVAPIDQFPEDRWDAIIADQPVVGLPRHQGGAAGHEERARSGRDHQHRLRARAGRIAEQERPTSPAKHGIVGFTKAAALETAEEGIRVNAICPGFVHTPLVQKQIEDRAREAGISEERAAKDIILAPQPTQGVRRPSSRSPPWRCSSASEAPRRSTARRSPSTEAGRP